MRTIAKIRDEILTVEECDMLTERTRRLLLFGILSELGYDVLQMQKFKYSAQQLKDRLVVTIRNQRCEIERLRKLLRNERRESEKRAQLLFDFFEKEQKKCHQEDK